MLPAVFDVTQVDIANGPHVLRATGRVLKSPGFLAVYGEARTPRRRTTSPRDGGRRGGPAPTCCRRSRGRRSCARWSSQKRAEVHPAAAAVQRGDAGQGARGERHRPALDLRRDPRRRSPSATTPRRVEGRFRPTALGKLVNRLLQQGFNDIINEGYTARLEEQLDEIEEGKLRLEAGARRVRQASSPRTSRRAGKELAQRQARGRADRRRSARKCGSPLVMRFGRYGAFLACSALPGVHDYTRDLEGRGTAAAPRTPAEDEVAPCEKCGKPMALRRSRFGQLPRLHRLSRVQEHPQDRPQGRAAEAHRRHLPGVRPG